MVDMNLDIFISGETIVLEESNATIDPKKGISIITTQHNLTVDEAQELIDFLTTAIERINFEKSEIEFEMEDGE